ncbi:MAG: amidohydrolase family protein, partial [Chloroflexi bacterium]|nr:amidohydrolase family protein [Chloroflexota bacterium]
CEELGLVVQMQVGHVLEAMPSKYGDPMQLDEISLHFPTLKLVGCHTGFPWSDELQSVCMKWENVYFGLTSWMPKYVSPAIVNYMNSLGREKCVWGGPGGPIKTALEQIEQLGLRDDSKENLLWKTATRVFNLDGA